MANLTAAAGAGLSPRNDNNRYLSWSQLGLTQQTDGPVSNAGIGQRWIAGKWLLGYNTFYDNLTDENLQRAGLGAEVWGKICACQPTIISPLPAGVSALTSGSSAWRADMTSPLKPGCRGSIT